MCKAVTRKQSIKGFTLCHIEDLNDIKEYDFEVRGDMFMLLNSQYFKIQEWKKSVVYCN